MSQIERMYRFRKNLLVGLVWASAIWAGLLVAWTIFVINKTIRPGLLFQLMRLIPIAVLASAAVVLFFLLKYWRFKWALRKDSMLRSAIDDERVSLSWFKAYRFAFFSVVALHVLFLLNGSVLQVAFHIRGLNLPGFAEYPLTLLIAVLSCLGSFLRYSREE